jgi:hypothetical protein
MIAATTNAPVETLKDLFIADDPFSDVKQRYRIATTSSFTALTV